MAYSGSKVTGRINRTACGSVERLDNWRKPRRGRDLAEARRRATDRYLLFKRLRPCRPSRSTNPLKAMAWFAARNRLATLSSICRQRSKAVSDIRQLPSSQAASVFKTLLRAMFASHPEGPALAITPHGEQP